MNFFLIDFDRKTQISKDRKMVQKEEDSSLDPWKFIFLKLYQAIHDILAALHVSLVLISVVVALT